MRASARALGAVLAAVLVVAGLPLGWAGAQPADGAAVSFRGVEATPWVTREGTWRTSLAVEGAPAGGRVRATIHDRVPDRPAYYRAVFTEVDTGRKAAIPPVDLATAPEAPGGGSLVALAVTLRADGQDQPGWKFLESGLQVGVFPVVVEVLDADDEEVARTVVFLTRVASGTEAGADDPPLLVAPVLPLSAPPSIEPDGSAALPDGAVERTEALAEGLARADDLAVTVAPRPETVEALDREDAGDGALDALRRAVDARPERQVLDAPYVDVPVSAWVEAGLTDELRRQRERGNTVLNGRLGGADSDTFLALDGLTPAAASALWDVGVRTVVLGPGTVEPAQPTTAPFALDGGAGRTLRGVQVDDGLSTALTRRRDPVLDRAGLAAELALLARSGSSIEGAALVAPESWPGSAAELAGVAEVLADPVAPVRAVTISDLVAAVPAGPARALRTVEPVDLGGQATLLPYARARLAAFVSMTRPGDPEVTALDQRLLLSGSTSLAPDVRRGYLDAVLAAVTERLAAVEAPPRQTVTLTSDEGVIPLSLRNALDEPVTVLVELEADTRVDFPDGATQEVTLAPGTTDVRIRVRARSPGDTPIDITLRTPDGSEQLDQVRYTVRSTAISGIGLVLSVGAAAFLLLWWFRHWRRSRRARRADRPAAV